MKIGLREGFEVAYSGTRKVQGLETFVICMIILHTSATTFDDDYSKQAGDMFVYCKLAFKMKVCNKVCAQMYTLAFYELVYLSLTNSSILSPSECEAIMIVPAAEQQRGPSHQHSLEKCFGLNFEFQKVQGGFF